MKRILLVLSIFFLGMSLMGCHHDSQKKPNDSMPEKFKPVLNPNPKYFMTVKGMIDPKLKDTIHLQWIATYNTTSDQCLKTINDFEGVHAPYEKKITVDVTTNINGNYQYKIPLDHYLPGFCGWGISGINYRIIISDKHSIADANTGLNFSNKIMPRHDNEISQKWFCNKKSCFLKNNTFPKNYRGFLSAKNSYKYTLNLEEKL